MGRLAGRLPRRFAELEALRAGQQGPARRSRWLTERLVLVRSAQGTVAIAIAPAWQIAAFVLCGLTMAVLMAGVVVVGIFRDASERQADEISQLRGETLAGAERAAYDHELLERLGVQLTKTDAERERATSAVAAGHRVVAQREAAVIHALAERARLQAERDAAVERAARVVEQANADRVRLEHERDIARAEHDDLAKEYGNALRDLDGETRHTLADVEKIIAAAGVDPRPGRQASGLQQAKPRGGPYIAWRGPPIASDEGGMGKFERANWRLERLKALRDALNQLPLVMPVTHAVITGGFGFRFDPFNGGSAYHEGLDLLASHDPVIHAPGVGTVISAGWNGQFGNMVELDHGFGVISRYAHLSHISVHKGDVVSTGQPLGIMGATGRATGTHLHYEIRVGGRARDPLKFLHAVDARQAGRDVPKENATHDELFAGFAQQ